MIDKGKYIEDVNDEVTEFITTHTGHVSFKNGWGEDISSLTVRHRRSNDPGEEEIKAVYNIPSGKEIKVMDFTYETGAGSSFDYWWIKFITNSGKEYQIKDNFYCSVSSSDDGNVKLRVDGADKKLYVTFSHSSSCQVSISSS
ncbi:hypothetical protein [Xenorhabdus szentirmaii]|uniref:Up-regulated in Daf-2 domain-containing protein n=2 Tax=Xenorhabdus szentirmaii TaxID=290112 RepID=W1IS55_9GAMM|nr:MULTISPECIES: hypothetical protein [Xenorhabdus]MBD2779628.1 hypothetical protein [Xenorhabdus sp. 38]MBD2801053.1 hypothetical protein [Xenorhabdus sp. M]PHM32795.1 hypothetical protein Xsze_03545 [Xenorhabdus szentirmaii DSM 16338]PHM40890.1 hypothetical protein Xszus_00565 [Xenorhabdus szentirmaii]CDL81269.1 conserved hypothetical protein [Xenorhabdus szentirmaii DSM 16338]